MKSQFHGGPPGGPPKLPPLPPKPGGRKKSSGAAPLLWIAAVAMAVFFILGLPLLGLDLGFFISRMVDLLREIYHNFGVWLCGGVCFSTVLMGLAGFFVWQYFSKKK